MKRRIAVVVALAALVAGVFYTRTLRSPDAPAAVSDQPFEGGDGPRRASPRPVHERWARWSSGCPDARV